MRLCQNGVHGAIDVFRTHAGGGGPWPRADAGVQAGIGIVSQALFFADALADAAHHAKLAQDAVGQVGLEKAGITARQSEPSQHHVALCLARDHCVRSAWCQDGAHSRKGWLLVFGAVPGAQRCLQYVETFFPGQRTDDSRSHPPCAIVPAVKRLDVLSRQAFDSLLGSQLAVPIGMVGVHQLAEAERSHRPGAVLALCQGSQDLSATPFDILGRKGRMIQAIGEDVHKQWQVFNQTLDRKASGMPAAANAQRRADGFDLFTGLGKGAPFCTACQQRCRHPGHPGLLGRYVGAAHPQPSVDDDRGAAHVLVGHPDHAVWEDAPADAFWAGQ